MTEPYTDDQLAAAAGQVQPPPVGTGPDADTMTARVSTASPTEVDVVALLAQMQAQQEAMAAEIARLKAGQPAGDVHPLVGSAVSARDLIATHVSQGGAAGDGPALVRLADDVVDAARNAVTSGNTGPVRSIAQRLERALLRVNPGPGDHHYWFHALDFIRSHVPDAADTVTAPAPSNAPALGGASPVPVIAGSVTG